MKNNDTLTNIFWTVFLAFMMIAVIATVIFVCWTFITYGDKPITDIPSWAFWVMQGR